MKDLLAYLVTRPAFVRVKIGMRGLKMGESQISAYELLRLFFKKIHRDEIRNRAYAVAFNLTLAVFPAIIFLFTLIPYIPIHDLDFRILSVLSEILPQSIYNDAIHIVTDIVNKPRSGLLSFGFFLALYMAGNGMLSLMNAFNNCYHKVEIRSFVKKQFVAIALTLVLAFILVLSIVLLIAGKFIIHELIGAGILSDKFVGMINLLRFATMILCLFAGISMIYRFAPAVPRKWSFFSAGCWISTSLVVLVSIGFSYYFDRFGTYNKLYGSIGAMIGFMIWLFAISLVLLVGFEINACIDEIKDDKEDMRLRRRV